MNCENAGRNSCCHYNLSEIIEKKGTIHFPSYYIEDYFSDFFEDMDIDYIINNNTAIVNKDDISWEELYIIKTESYSSLIWYSYIKDYTYKSEFIPVSLEDLLNLDNMLYGIIFPKFIKLDTVSCKDTGHSSVFNSIEELMFVFNSSFRIKKTLEQLPLSKDSHYLFIREVDYEISKSIEIRCFIHASRLVAISCDVYFSHDKENLYKYINTVIGLLPYRDAIIDVACLSNKNTVIEINNFGADSPAGSGNFNWSEDYNILYGGLEEIIWR